MGGEMTGEEWTGKEERGMEGRGMEGRKGKERGGEGEEGGRCPPNADSWIRPYAMLHRFDP